MSDDHWDDAYAPDDPAAQERARRRAEREARRRERQAGLGKRVEEAQAPPPPAAPPAAPPQAPAPADPDPAGAVPEPTRALPEEPAAYEPPPEEPLDAPPPPPGRGGRPPRGVVARRRVGARVGLAALAFIAFVVVVAAQRLGGDDEAAAPPPKERKTVSVTIPEGFSRDQVAGVAKKAGLKGDYVKATESAKGFKPEKYGVKNPPSLEGFLFPATYEVFANDTVEDLVAKQLEAFEQNIASIDLSFAESRQLTAYDVVKIASMIEREVQVADERADVSSVIYNRLEAGMPLGIDATIRFEDSNYNKQLLESRLNEDTPYNTRINTGLPPGPIGNPGLASLEAAAKPAKNDYRYFVVEPGTCGEHVFAETEEEFFAAEAAYQAALQAEGGSPTDC